MLKLNAGMQETTVVNAGLILSRGLGESTGKELTKLQQDGED